MNGFIYQRRGGNNFNKNGLPRKLTGSPVILKVSLVCDRKILSE
jgi:hypothetical protein